MVTAYLVFSAFLAWHLSGLAATQPRSVGALGWAFAGVQVACLALSLRYFFPLPAMISAALVACLGWAAWLARGAG
jgi:hypothetical protein